MNSSAAADHFDDMVEDEEIFLDEGDIIQEILVDEEDEPDDSIQVFTGHTGEVYSVACSPTDPNLVATGGGDDKGFLWEIGPGDWFVELEDADDLVYSVGFSSDGQLLAAGSFDGLVKVWDMSSQNVKCTLHGPSEGIEWLKWHPREHLVLAGSEDCTVRLWNADRGDFLNIFAGHCRTVTCGDFTPDGQTICTGSGDGTLRIWNPKSGETIHVVNGHMDELTCMSLSSDSTLALTGSLDSSVHLVNITTGKVVGSLTDHSDSVECVGFASSSSAWAATGGLDRKLVIWDLQRLSSRCTCEHEKGVTCLTWLGASRYLATGSYDGKVRIWDSLSGDCVRTFCGHGRHQDGAVQSLAVSANGDFLVSASLDSTARVFEIKGFFQ